MYKRKLNKNYGLIEKTKDTLEGDGEFSNEIGGFQKKQWLKQSNSQADTHQTSK